MKKHLTILALFLLTINSYSQVCFTFDTEGKSKEFEFKSKDPDLDAKDLFENALDWANKYYVMPQLVVDENISDSIITISGGLYKTFDIDVSNYQPNEKIYDSNYILTIKFYDGEYTVKYEHKNFSVNDETISLSLTHIIQNPSQYDENWIKNYEYRVERLIYSLTHYMETSELVYK